MQEDSLKGYYGLRRSESPTWDEGYFYLDVDASIEKEDTVFLPLMSIEISATPFISIGLKKARLGFF